ncbi:Stealth CR1 domain-containing protein [Lactobacillus corticis]|uniref:Glycosyltransferase n=1 Tax=Lactobacillus corticis TaxID=2201249 RepID=A0A916QF71_9LACO|nr:Stealth CR1 domain-containing protein [Lactobacillus corticis]GFZ26171.1 glycosyltransferase [Lactobacillus corticis]
MKIDFVVTWVDGADPIWLEKKNKYGQAENNVDDLHKKMSSDKAYRDWGTFKFWFRGVEKFAPWVNHVYVVTDNQKPDWLNEDYSKVTIIDHSQIIDNKYLPVFNANAIEPNVYKIPNLSEHFVLFNDDMYLTRSVTPTDFFDNNGLPVYNTALSPIIPQSGGTANFQVNIMEIINDHFSKKEIIDKGHFFNIHQGLKLFIKSLIYSRSKFICGFYETHLPYPLRKSTFQEVWKEEKDTLDSTSSHRFRQASDVSNWLFKYWEIARGTYSVGDYHLGTLVSLDDAGSGLWNLILSQKYKIVCVNDGFKVDADKVNSEFVQVMEKLLPEKCSFEK